VDGLIRVRVSEKVLGCGGGIARTGIRVRERPVARRDGATISASGVAI
jgi:hypothetical protein